MLKNQDVGSSWNFATTLSKVTTFGLQMRGAYSYNTSKNTVDPGSIAFGSWAGNPHASDPNNPGVGYSTPFSASLGHRVFVNASFTHEYFGFGGTTVSMFWEARNGGNTSYVFAGDMNNDGASNSDLIYIPRDTSEMNFASFTQSGRTFTPAEQAAAFEAYIQQDSYLREHRGEYARARCGVAPVLQPDGPEISCRISLATSGPPQLGQLRLDIINFGNLLNSGWGIGDRLIRNQILTNPAVDAQGRSTYRLAVVNNELLSRSFETTASQSDVWSMMLSFRYTFN